MNRALAVGLVAAATLGIGAVAASAGSDSGTVDLVPVCTPIPGGIACAQDIPGVLEGTGKLVSDPASGLNGTMSGSVQGVTSGHLTGALQGTSGFIDGSVDGVLSGSITGDLDVTGPVGADGFLCGDLDLAGQTILDGGIVGSADNGRLDVDLGGVLAGIPGAVGIDPVTGLVITEEGPC
ncbi:MAG: hypothetical protein ACT4PW_11140 [Acidimicrobiia bacterium]